MKLKINILSFFISVFSICVYAQQTTSIPLKYDVSGYAENNTQTKSQRIAAPDNALTPTVNAEMNASESGALNYMLPIEILKGVNNFQPNFAVAYNSQSGNGQAGWGWNIVGLSTITQGGKSKEIDGITIGPQFNSSDPFYLDGQRLIKNTATDFVTEKFSKIKITKQTSGEFSFIVQYTDGRVAKYKEIIPGQHYITTFIDSFNNQIHYTYSVLGNTSRLTQCSYGGNDVATDKFYINFNYKDRKNEIKIYRNGVEFTNSKIIDFIESGSTFSGKYRKYNFTYDFIEGNAIERLITVTVENEGGETLKPLNFNYNTSNQGQITETQYYSPSLGADATGLGSVAVGNFTKINDNLEAIYQVRTGTGYKMQSSNSATIDQQLGNNTSSTDFYNGKTLINGKISDNDQLITTNVNYLGTPNLNDPYDPINENLQDEVSFNITDYKNNFKRQVNIILKGTLQERINYHEELTANDYDNPYSGNTGGTLMYFRDKTKREYIPGDFNNDGLIDFIILERSGLNRTNRVYFVEIGKTTGANASPIIINETLEFKDKDLNAIEFDGDGLPELMCVDKINKNYCVYKIDFETNTLKKVLQEQPLNNFAYNTPIFYGDFNGDGLTDFITPQKVYNFSDENTPFEISFQNMENEQKLWWKYTSKGNSFAPQTEDYTSLRLAYILPSQSNVIKRTSFWEKFWSGKMDQYLYTRYATTNIMVTDFNNDGRSDIISLVKIGKVKYKPDGKLAGADVQNYNPLMSIETGQFEQDGYTPIYNYIPSIYANKLHFYENVSFNKEHQGKDFTIRQTIDINEKKISPLSLILPQTDVNQLNTYKSGVFIHDPLLGKNTFIVVNNDNFLEKQITSVDNGSSVIQSIEYKPMIPSKDKSEACYIFNDAYQYQYPYYTHNTNGSYYLVNKIHTLFDGKILTKEYRYENGVQQLDGKGFLGFRKTYSSDAYESELVNGKYRIKDPFKAVFWNIQTRNPLMENAVEVSTYGGIKDFFTINTVTNKKFDRGNHQYLILSTIEISKDNLKKITISKKYDYDENDDLKLKTAYTDYNGIGTTISKYTYTPEFYNGDHYFYGKIATSEDTTYKDGFSFTTKQETTYDTTNGSATEVKKYGNDANAPPIVNKYTFYPEGNLKTETLSATGFTDQVTSYEYDSTKRYVNKTTTPDGLFSTSVVNALGRVSSEVSPLGLTTSYTYDSWGNITEITDYLGKKTTISKSAVTSPTGAVYSLSKKREGGTETVVVFDKFDREILSKTQSINGKWLVAKTEYDIFGRKVRTSEPFFEGETEKWNSVEYDELGRPVKNKAFTGKTITTCYEGMKVTVDDGYKKTSKTLDAMGNTIRHQDHGGVINYSYYPNGALRETNYEGIKTKFLIDGWGNKKQIIDPSAGTFNYEYDNLSRIKKEINPKGTTEYTYDTLGRPLTETTTGKTTAENTTIVKTYTYNANTKLPETITGTSNGKTFTYTTYYDNYYRITGKKEQTPDFEYSSSTTFDSYGKADVVTITTKLNNPNYTSTSAIKNVYDANGILIQQNDNATNTMVWHVSDVNAQGQTTQMEYGNGYTITNQYRPSDLSLWTIKHQNTTTGNVALDLEYDYNVDKGILNYRDNKTFGKKETFTFDKLTRLLTESINGTLTNQYTYDKRGRMTSNTEIGKYNYNETDYKLQNLAFNTNGQNVNTQRGFAKISYNAFKSPLQITLAGKDDLQFEYNILKTRYAMNSSVTGKQKLYSSDFAIEITKQGNKTQIVTFITGDPYSANYIKKEVLTGNTLTETGKYYLHRDNLGSILAITKTDGSVVEKRFYDAWGNLKGLVNSVGTLITDAQQLATANLFLDRGYTGHEHLQSVGLINMNARIYDPVLRRFMSPDNYVQDPFNTQSYNRYGYVGNNPLLYTDPTGNFGILAAVLIGLAVGIVSNGIQNMINGIPFWYGMGKAGVMGAVSGAISFGIGSWAKDIFGTIVSVGKALFQAGMHGLSSGLMSALDGGKFGAAFLSGFISSAISSGIESLGQTGEVGTKLIDGKNVEFAKLNDFGKSGWYKASIIASGGLSGGISSRIAGGSFIAGFRQGLITSGLNHVASMVAERVGNKGGIKVDKETKKQFRALRRDKNYQGAFDLVNSKYNLDADVKNKYTISFVDTDDFSGTTGGEAFETQSVEIAKSAFGGSAAHLIRVVHHEFVHVYQRGVLGFAGNLIITEVREFLAYHDTFFNKDIPNARFWEMSGYWDKAKPFFDYIDSNTALKNAYRSQYNDFVKSGHFK